MAMLAARRAYRSVVDAARLEHERMHQTQLINAYFSEAQRDFWRVFNSGKAPVCPNSDMAAWTAHFISVLGQQPSPLQLSAQNQQAKAQLLSHTAVDANIMSSVNEPVTELEVAGVMQSLPCGKAADCDGLTCELFKHAASSGVEQQPSPSPQPLTAYACQPLVECMTWVVSTLLTQQGPEAMHSLPATMQTASLAPVPKPLARQDPLNTNLYRGIAVGSIFKRVVARVMKNRADKLIESKGLRAATQCGFREGHGCLDALFVLQHLIHSARADDALLWVVFVDFKKAFDKVRRDLLIDRCQNLGISGPFLQALEMMYDKVLMRVKVNGHIGETFETYVGTEQGSELSPLLFGIFMDLLHELISQKVEGAGPVVGNMRVPDLMYADDVNLVARNPEQMQQLLDCLSVFCYIFDMEVNLDPHKTCCVVFRKGRVPRPEVTLLYRGQPLAFKASYTYLGLWLHETERLDACATVLAGSADNALKALLSRLRQHHIAQFDMRCRMFDTLVEPVLSYGSQIWGPWMLSQFLMRRGGTVCSADVLHHRFLCYTAGLAPNGKDRNMVLREFHRVSLPYRWALLVVSWWEKLRSMPATRIAHQAWQADIELMLGGCTDCWSYHCLLAMENLGLIGPQQWRSGVPGVTCEAVMGLGISRQVVHTALEAALRQKWALAYGNNVDPRNGGVGVQLRTHIFWVHEIHASVVLSRANAPAYMKLCLPLKKLQCLARYRLGGQHLEGRRNHSIATRQRYCPLCTANKDTCRQIWHDRILARCGVNQPEDLLHFMLECPAYDHIRELFPMVFHLPAHALPCDRLRSAFDCADQRNLLQCVWVMDLYRSYLLGSKYPQGAHIAHQPLEYVPADPALRCNADLLLQQRQRLWQLFKAILPIATAILAVGLTYVLLH
jgi:sorting nexin-29